MLAAFTFTTSPVKMPAVLTLIRDPLPAWKVAAVSVAVALFVAVYCLVYTALAGRPEPLDEALVWAVVNVLPWIPALEGVKRARSFLAVAAWLAAGLVASLTLGSLPAGTVSDLGFELWRRVPVLLLLVAAAAGLYWTTSRQRARSIEDLPLLPRQIDWVRAAGNYVELRSSGRTVVHRTALSTVERQLSGHDFVRIHRSILVRRRSIKRIRTDDVVLADGTHLRIGKRYRSSLTA